MKYLKKPHLPIFILFILLSAFGYNEFIKEKYTKQEKIILVNGYEQNDDLKNVYLNLVERLEENARRNWLEGGSNSCTKESYSNFEKKIGKIREICIQTIENHFEKKIIENINESENLPLKVKNPKITTAFYNYINKVSKLDTIFAKKYQNFIFEEGMNDEQINDFYFDTDDYLRAFHFARFEAQLARMYYEDAKLLDKKNYYAPHDLKIEEAKIIPYLTPSRQTNAKDSEYTIYESVCFPFNKKALIVYPENIITKFDKNGFIIIPEEYRKGLQEFKIKFPIDCNSDTIMSAQLDFKGRENFYKNATK
jgi:hypothetical protein